jgi:putative redox protein
LSDEAKRTVEVTLTSVGMAAYEATGARSGGKIVLDGPPDIGGEGRGMRPMELLLSALAGCSVMDVGKILRQQREPLEGLRVEVKGLRADAVPSPYTEIHLVFIARGAVAPQKLERAVRLAVEKYCSVGASLAPEIRVTHEARLEPST